MSYVLNTTIADEFANSYCDVPYADFYFENHFLTTKADAWAALTDEQKTAALITGCRSLEQIRFTQPSVYGGGYINWYNRRTGKVQSFGLEKQLFKYYYFQALQFPRQVDQKTTDGSTYIPEPIKLAQCEQALYELTFDDSILAGRLQGVSRESTTLGTLKVSQTTNGLGVNICPAALSYVRPYIIKISARVGRA